MIEIALIYVEIRRIVTLTKFHSCTEMSQSLQASNPKYVKFISISLHLLRIGPENVGMLNAHLLPIQQLLISNFGALLVNIHNGVVFQKDPIKYQNKYFPSQ